MSGAFVNEDATHEPEPRYALPSREGLGDERLGRLGPTLSPRREPLWDGSRRPPRRADPFAPVTVELTGAWIETTATSGRMGAGFVCPDCRGPRPCVEAKTWIGYPG